MNHQLDSRSESRPSLVMQEMTGQQLSDRYTQELRRLRSLTRHGRHSPHFQGYPNSAIMHGCKRELERRGLPVPPVNASDTDEGGHKNA